MVKQRLLSFRFCRLGTSAVLGRTAQFRRVSGLWSTKPGLVLRIQQPQLLASTDSQLTLVYQNTLDKKNVLVPETEMFFFVVYVFPQTRCLVVHEYEL